MLILLPTQLGKHFWPDWSFYYGVRIDYFSPTIYLTDLLVGLIFLIDLPKIVRDFKLKNLAKLAIIVSLVFLNVFYSYSPSLTLYKWIKILEIGFVVFWIAKRIKNKELHIFAYILLMPIFYESILLSWQFINQASIGGLWYWIGERHFISTTIGIANTIIFGELVLRPYGTLPHPNVLGGFLAVCLSYIVYYFPWKRTFFPYISRIIPALIIAIGFGCLFLSLSRSAIFAGVIGMMIIIVHKYKRGLNNWKFGIIGGLAILLIVLPVMNESLSFREMLNVTALAEWSNSPIIGTGLGTSPIYKSGLTNFALAHQPTHNIYFMVFGEVGLVGLISLIWIIGVSIIKSYRKKRWGVLVALCTLMFLGMFDHYFLTLQQGQLLLAVIIGFAFVGEEKTARIV